MRPIAPRPRSPVSTGRSIAICWSSSPTGPRAVRGTAALARGMHELLTDPGRRMVLGNAGRQGVREGFTDEVMARHMMRVYEQTLREMTTAR